MTPVVEDKDEEFAEVLTEAEQRFERGRRSIGLILGPLVLAALLLWPPGGLSREAQLLSAVLGFVLTYWVTEPIPIPVTAVLGAALCVLLGVAPAKTVLAPFADPIVFLFIGSFILARAMMKHGLDRRFAFGILSMPWIGARPGRILLAFGAVSAFISMWISNTAATAMMLPIGLGILGGMGAMKRGAASDSARASGSTGPSAAGVSVGAGAAGSSATPIEMSPYATSLMLMAAYAASVGGIGTPVGTPPNLIAIGMIERLLGVKISFFRWMTLAVPMLVIMFGALYFLLSRLHRMPRVEFEGTADFVREVRRSLGRWTAGERNCVIAFGAAVTFWILPGVVAAVFGPSAHATKWFAERLPEGVVALFAASLLFFLPVRWRTREFTITWNDAVHIDWGTILLFGGGLSLGALMFTTGLAEAIGKGMLDVTGAHGLWAITASAIALGIVISETTSNTASANMVIPVVIALSQAAGVSGLPPALGACFGASFGFMLPVSTPPNAIVYGSGLVPITRMIRAGIFFDLIGFALIWVALRVLCPVLGFV